VIAESRLEAISRLQQVGAVELEQADAARLVGVETSALRAESLAPLLVGREINQLEERKSSVFGGLGGTWNRADEERLERQRAFRTNQSTQAKNSFLVRAVVKTAGPLSRFEARVCDDVLIVRHFEPPSAGSPLQRQPIVALLGSAPPRVLVE